MKLLKHLKKIVVGMLATGSTMVLAACYGPMEDYRKVADGHITDGMGNPIGGLKVCVVDQGVDTMCDTTFTDGYYLIDEIDSNVNSLEDNGFQICVEDIDGIENGGLFLDECVTIQPGALPVQVDFDMDLAK
jgi:hypothetical protein